MFVMNSWKKAVGQKHLRTVHSMASLASTISEQGRWEEAEAIATDVVAAKAKVLGPEHPSTLTSLNNLATLFSHQGRYK